MKTLLSFDFLAFTILIAAAQNLGNFREIGFEEGFKIIRWISFPQPYQFQNVYTKITTFCFWTVPKSVKLCMCNCYSKKILLLEWIKKNVSVPLTWMKLNQTCVFYTKALNYRTSSNLRIVGIEYYSQMKCV